MARKRIETFIHFKLLLYKIFDSSRCGPGDQWDNNWLQYQGERRPKNSEDWNQSRYARISLFLIGEFILKIDLFLFPVLCTRLILDFIHGPK